MIKINVFVSDKNWKKYIKKPNNYLKRKIKLLNTKDNFFKNKNINFTLLLSGDHEIKRINKKFRKKNDTTDVLSFPFHEEQELKKLLRNDTKFYLGDIIVNLSKIINKSNGNNFKIKFDKLWIHGLVHLLGYRHKINKDYLKMKKIENKFFRLIN